MAAAVWLVGAERLHQQLVRVAPAWLVAAVVAAAAAQVVSVFRWETISRIFRLHVQRRTLAIAYTQGMALNVLLPGATLGGDALRSLRLQALGNPLGVSALTVVLDRLSGLWVLCVLSLLTGLGVAAVLAMGAIAGLDSAALVAAPADAPIARAWPAAGLGVRGLLLAYLAGLALVCAIPWLPLRARVAAPPPAPRLAERVWKRVCDLHDLAVAQRAALGRSLWSSLLVQVLCALALWLCLRAAGGSAAYWQVQAVAAPIFVAGALPLSYGGFGARELAALLAFPLLGMPADQGLAASVLYGIVAIILGVAAAPAFALTPVRPQDLVRAPAPDAVGS